MCIRDSSWTPTLWSRACSASTWSWATRPVGMALWGTLDEALDDVSNERTLAQIRRLDGALLATDAWLG
eukprot:5176626-Alexandrium_andersonii.AAC.1